MSLYIDSRQYFHIQGVSDCLCNNSLHIIPLVYEDFAILIIQAVDVSLLVCLKSVAQQCL